MEILSGLKTKNGGGIPNVIKIGDVYANTGLAHPAMIFKIEGEIAHSVLLTTDESCTNAIKKCNSRFFSQGWFTNTIISSKKEHVLGNFMGIYDNMADIKEMKKLLKETYLKLFK